MNRFHSCGDHERQIGERVSVALLEFRFVAISQFRNLRQVGLVNGGDVGRRALAREHVLGNLGAHNAHRFHASLRRLCTRHGRGRGGRRRGGLSSSSWRGGLRHSFCALRRHVSFQILLADASARTGAFHLAKIDVVLACHFANQRRERSIGSHRLLWLRNRNRIGTRGACHRFLAGLRNERLLNGGGGRSRWRWFRGRRCRSGLGRGSPKR